MTQSPLADLLSAWLPAQRWFAGSGSLVREIEITSDVQLAAGDADDPELRHLMVDVWIGPAMASPERASPERASTERASTEKVTYQVLLGLRAQLPPALTAAVIGTLADGRVAYDGARDPELSAVLLRGIATQRRAGPLRFEAEPGARIDDTATPRALPALASNTSIVFGDQTILKLLRRPFTGDHPDLEVPAALARNGSKLVAAPLGWIEMPDAGQSTTVQATNTAASPAAANSPEPDTAGSPAANRGPGPAGSPAAKSATSAPRPGDSPAAKSAVLAILSVFFANSSDGWSLATASLQSAEPDFSRQARLLGATTAELHIELAAAFGTSVLSRFALTDLVDAMNTELTQAIPVVPQLREHQAAIRACFASLAELDTQVQVQRIHGDYHLAQVLGTDGGWVVLDFEGEPSVPLARRRAFVPALRDVAGMLRSFDYAARHQAMRARQGQQAQPVPAGQGAAEYAGVEQAAVEQAAVERAAADQAAAYLAAADQAAAEQAAEQSAAEWVRRCQDAFCAGYADLMGADPRSSGPLLRALTLQKAIYEAVYEARHRPDWLPIPLAAIAEASR